MQPIFKIIADRQDITSIILKRLISISIAFESEDRVDTATLTIDNSSPYLEPPKTGTKLEIQYGYKETGLIEEPLTFTVDEIQYFGPPYSLTIRARSANLMSPIKSHKEKTWESTTFKGILEEIANEYGYEAVVEDGIADFEVEYFPQRHSDFATLGELALENLGANISVQIIQNKIVISKRGIKIKIKSKSAIETTQIPKEQIIRYRTTVAERGKYSRVKARWHDPEKAEDFFEIAGEGEPALTIQRTYADPLEAQRAAESQLVALSQGRATLHASLIGTPALLPQLPVELTGLPPGVEGEWIICSVTHKIDSNGFTTELTAKSHQQIQKELEEQNVEAEE